MIKTEGTIKDRESESKAYITISTEGDTFTLKHYSVSISVPLEDVLEVLKQYIEKGRQGVGER